MLIGVSAGGLLVAGGQLILAVNVSSPVQSVKDLIALANTQPGSSTSRKRAWGGITHVAGVKSPSRH